MVVLRGNWARAGWEKSPPSCEGCFPHHSGGMWGEFMTPKRTIDGRYVCVECDKKYRVEKVAE